MRILVTGGAGFIGSALVRYLISNTECQVLNLDKLTYAGNVDSLSSVSENPRYKFRRADVCDRQALDHVIESFRPTLVMHLAAESHVDRSIDRPTDFINTNILGTFTLLESCRAYWEDLDEDDRNSFRFHHVSTDEVYGDLGPEDSPFTEKTSYAPSSPYSASKAGSDHLVRAWHRTYGLPVVLTNCSNNYGPFQFPEKLIPLMILNAIAQRPLPVYGKGDQIRDWLHVDDHVRALLLVSRRGVSGETYNIGGRSELENIQVVRTICRILDDLYPAGPAFDQNVRDGKNMLSKGNFSSYEQLITFVEDRPGHDRRYAMNISKIESEFGWKPSHTFESGLRETVQWYLDNPDWYRRVQDGSYRRLGLAGNCSGLLGERV